MNRTLRIATVDVAFGRKAPLQRPPRERPEWAPKPSFGGERELPGLPKGHSSDGCSSEGPFYSPAIAETVGLSFTGMPLRIDCPTTASTSLSSVQSFMDTPACAAATFCQR